MLIYYYELRKYELTEFNDWHNSHSTYGVIKDSILNSIKKEIKERLNQDNQGLLSLLLVIERKYNLNLSSKQIYNLRDKDLGEKNKMLQADKEVDKMLCDSAMLIKYLSNDINIIFIMYYISKYNLILSKYQVKYFTKPVDIIGNPYNFH